MDECMLDGYSVKYPTLLNPTKADMFRIVLGIDVNSDDYDPLDYEDLMEDCACVMFPHWWRDHVRQEQKQIGRNIHKKNLVCSECGSKDGIELHHIIPPIFRIDAYGGNDPDNIQLLCHDCHKKTMNNKYREGINNYLMKMEEQ